MTNPYRALRRRLSFYARHTPAELAHARAYFSQYGEDIFLREYFRGRAGGFYVDVGAFDPVAYSNTYGFYRAGWRGIAVEPHPAKRAAFARRRPGDLVLACAVSDADGTAEFAVEGEFSGIVDDRFLHPGKTARRIVVPTRTLRGILAEHLPPGRSVDFLSVDCEGHDEAVLRSNDWGRYRPLVVLAEAFDPAGADRLAGFLGDQGYGRIGACGPTLVFEDGRPRTDRPPAYHRAPPESGAAG